MVCMIEGIDIEASIGAIIILCGAIGAAVKMYGRANRYLELASRVLDVIQALFEIVNEYIARSPDGLSKEDYEAIGIKTVNLMLRVHTDPEIPAVFPALEANKEE